VCKDARPDVRQGGSVDDTDQQRIHDAVAGIHLLARALPYKNCECEPCDGDRRDIRQELNQD
jgi:hypothetical protein